MPSFPQADLPPGFVSRLERFDRVASTQAVVHGWLDDGLPEVCVAVADVQTAGRGRLGRTWQDRSGQTLLVSAGFRPAALAATQAWWLPAVMSMAMLEAATALIADGADRLALKWPNDLVAVHGDRVLKVGGVLADSVLEGTQVRTAVVGIGVNVDWPAEAFPVGLASSMWSLREARGGRAVDREALLSGWLLRLGPLYAALSGGHFDSRPWAAAQVTTGAKVEIETGEGLETGRAEGVDEDSGALLLRPSTGGPRRDILAGDVVRCRIRQPAPPL